MDSIKTIARNYIGPTNYKKDTKELVEEIYRLFGIDLERVNGLHLLYGTPKVPKLMSVIRRVQMVKKYQATKIAKLEAKEKEQCVQ